jgi:hypothetical protein
MTVTQWVLSAFGSAVDPAGRERCVYHAGVAHPSPEPLECPDAELMRRTRLALAVAARDLNEYVMSLAVTYGEDEVDPDGFYTRLARHASKLFVRVKVLSVLSDRIVRGTPWETIGGRLGMLPSDVVGIYGPMEERWRGGDPAPWALLFGAEAAPDALEAFLPIRIPPGRIESLSRELDAYCARILGRDASLRRTRFGRDRRGVTPGLPGRAPTSAPRSR